MPAKPSVGATTPMLPATGSTIRAAILFPCSAKSVFTESISLYLARRVQLATDSGTPGLFGTPRVAAPEPAAIRKLSPWP